MFKFLKKIFLKDKKDVSLKEAYSNMDKILSEAEIVDGKNFFPEDKDKLTPDEIHYKSLGLPVESNFEEITNKYNQIKVTLNLEDKESAEKLARADFAYEYFKKKFTE